MRRAHESIRNGMLPPYQSVERPRPGADTDQEKQTHRHRKVRPRVAYHKPKTLVRAKQFRELGRRNRGQDYDQERNAGDPCEQADQDQKAARNLEGSDEMRSEIGVQKSNLREAEDSQGRVDEFENSLSEKDQACGQSNKDDASCVPGRSEKSIHSNSSNRCAHNRPGGHTNQFRNRLPPNVCTRISENAI
jgi:hypothetical protein